MQEIIVTNQAELDALPASFPEQTRIVIKARTRIVVNKARENSSVVARGNSSVEAWGNSSVEAWGNSSVEARENSSVVAWENSSVEAWENSSVVAWENSSVVARGNSSVEARGNVCVRIQSDFSSVVLWAFAVAYLLTKNAKAKKKSKTATVITPKSSIGVPGWLEDNAVKPDKSVVLFKRVSSDYKTQEFTENETTWTIGTTLVHATWNPTISECGAGKYHACSRPYFCDEFRSNTGDRYIAISIKKTDLHAWPTPNYPHKIAFRAGTVLYEVDRHGRKLEAK